MPFHKLIEGTSYSDDRGSINFINTFQMDDITRMYEIAPNNTDTIRGWQGHKEEKKWFYCSQGAFILNLIAIDNFNLPSKTIVPQRFILEANKPSILEITGGYATGFKANENNSKLIVFSNFSLDASKKDDFRYPIEQWHAKW